MSRARHSSAERGLRASLILIAMVMAFGTAGYSMIEGWSFFDSLYMTVITITTIGFKEVHEMTEAGRMFTVGLVVFSVGAVFYALNNAARVVIEGELNDIFGRRKLEKAISKLKDHYILCGHGRMGSIIAQKFMHEGTPFVVIEKEAAEHDADILVIEGDATRDDILLMAGIERAKGLIAVLPTDAENLYVVLSARGLNKTLKIVTRSVEDDAEQKLMRAGADKVVSPYYMGGLRIAHTVLKPAVVDFMELTIGSKSLGLDIEELRIEDTSKLCGTTVAQSGIGREYNIIIVAVKKSDGQLRVSPPHSYIFEPGDTLVIIGEEENLDKLAKLAA